MTDGNKAIQSLSAKRSILVTEYMERIAPTDRLPPDEIRPVLMGLFGEVGSVMATAKKPYREKEAYFGFRKAVEEEFGDVLWYFNALCRRLNIKTEEIISSAANGAGNAKLVAASDLICGPVAHISSTAELPALDVVLLNLGTACSSLLGIEAPTDQTRNLLREFAACYLQTLQAADISFAQVVHTNLEKACGRFLNPHPASLPTFDEMFSDDEKLPEHFEITITQRKSGQAYLQLNGVFVGDPLTDNIRDPDGYRFHDVFHFAHAAILHWSPVFRALLKRKRKSDRKTDEAQDGGRAIVVEEGLTAWIFARAKELDFFQTQTSVSFDCLKTIQQFTHGYEVGECPLRQWEIAILEGYKVFLQVREHNGGVIIGDRRSRTIKYKAI